MAPLQSLYSGFTAVFHILNMTFRRNESLTFPLSFTHTSANETLKATSICVSQTPQLILPDVIGGLSDV